MRGLCLPRGVTLSPLFAQRPLLQALHLKHPCVTLLPQLQVLDWHCISVVHGQQNQPQCLQRMDLSGFHSLKILNLFTVGRPSLQCSRLVLPKGLHMVRISCPGAGPTFPHIDMDSASVHQLVLKNVLWNMPVELPNCQYLELKQCPNIRDIRVPLCEGIKVQACKYLKCIHEPLTQLVVLEISDCLELHRIPRGRMRGYRCLKVVNMCLFDMPDQSYLDHVAGGVMVLFRPGPFPWIPDLVFLEHVMRMWRWCIDVDECDVTSMLEQDPEYTDIQDNVVVEDLSDPMLRFIATRRLRGCNYPVFATKIQRVWRHARYTYGTMPTLLACTPIASSLAKFVVSEYVGAPPYMGCKEVMALRRKKLMQSQDAPPLKQLVLTVPTQGGPPSSKRTRL